MGGGGAVILEEVPFSSFSLAGVKTSHACLPMHAYPMIAYELIPCLPAPCISCMPAHAAEAEHLPPPFLCEPTRLAGLPAPVRRVRPP